MVELVADTILDHPARGDVPPQPCSIHACWARGIKLGFQKRTMKTEKKPLGRPKKKEGAIACWRLFRDVMVVSAYAEARESGEKHSAAVTQAVDHVRQRCSEMRISETEVKRTLAIYQPRNNQIIFQFKRVTLHESELMRQRNVLEQAVAELRGKKGLWKPLPSIQDSPKSRTAYTFAYAERPLYPRHNRKTPKE